MKKTARPSLSSTLYGYRYGLGLLIVLLLGAFFRFQHLAGLPPGLSNDEASTASASLQIMQKALTPTQLFNQGFASGIFNFIVAVSVKLLGATSFALRLPSALLGMAAVLMVYLWLKAWFDNKIALVAALLVAVTPWTVGFSRLALPNIATMLVVPTSLWLLTNAVRTKKLQWTAPAGIALALCVSGVAGLWFLIGLAVAMMPFGLLKLVKDRSLRRSGLIVCAIAVVLGAPMVLWRFHAAKMHLPSINIPSAVSHASQTLGMFNIHGDNDFQFNIAGTPELNLFVGLMFLIGLLVCLTRFRQAKYRLLLILIAILLIPIMAQSSTPNSLTALIAAPIVLSLAAMGIIYMLEVWYSTFPVNSAARTLGTVPIVLLLTISTYQGYRQYFSAWARSPETYTAYNEPATALASYLNRVNFSGQRYVLAQGHDVGIINFLTYKKGHFTQITAGQIASLPQPTQPQQIIFTTPQPTDIIPSLKQRFPKAQLSQHFSEFNDNNQLFAVYQTKP